jgi:2-desacetyl-2-hydroxyethyl bacteriochlorophyllide A dehydrogenase
MDRQIDASNLPQAGPHASFPSSMLAAVYRAPRRLTVEERAVPAIGPRDVLIEVSHCGICGTDLHFVLEGMGRPGSIGGHEYSGRIVALGDEVEGWAAGDPVVGGPRPGCGRCEYCRAGRAVLCSGRSLVDLDEFEGAFAEYVRVHESQLVRVPARLPLRHAALAEPLAVALHALTRSGIRPGQRALVTGAGPIGLLVVAALHARGVEDVSVSEPAATRRDRARDVGAARVLHPDELEAQGLPFRLVGSPVDVVFECSGRPTAMESGLTQLKRAGTLVMVGTGLARPTFDHNRILLNELVVTGAFNYDDGGFEEALQLLASGALPVEQLIEREDVSLGGMLEALFELEHGGRPAKVMVAPRAAT